MRRGELPERLWTELYFQTVHDPAVAPEGHAHDERLLAVRALRVRRGRLGVAPRGGEAAWASPRIGRFVSNFPDAVVDVEVLGPPDIEREVGLTGGHIFQGECLPQYMWDQRLRYRTPMPGVYLCGACTHPGGSVIAVNGRNAAMAVLRDTAGT